MSDHTIEVIENTTKLEVTSSTESETSVVEIVQSDTIELELSTNIALLPSSFEDNTKIIISETLVGVSGIVIGPLIYGNIAISTSGLQPSGNYSLDGHSHSSSDITNFNSSVSGLLPVKNISAGSGIGVTNNSGDFTVSVTGTFGLTGEQVDDRVSDLLKSGPYVNLDYNDSLDSLTISVTGLQPSGDYSLLGHNHNISDITNLQTILDSKQASGVYASGIHYHASSDITNFNSSVSGLLPVKNISSGSGISVTNNSGDFIVAVSGTFGLTGEEVDDRINDLLIAGSNIVLNYDDLANQLTISTSGLQPSGNYSLVGHTHAISQISGLSTEHERLREGVVGAKYWIPSEDEWYKAAYYKGGGINSGYWNYATQSDSAPLSVTADASGNGSAGGSGNYANYLNTAYWNEIQNVTTVGTNGGPSAYGTYDQTGNVYNWNDSINRSVILAQNELRGMRGGDHDTTIASRMSKNFRLPTSTESFGVPSTAFYDVGFRIATKDNPLGLSNFVTVGDPRNTPDTNGYGQVNYSYQIGAYDVTNDEFAEFLNAIGSSDPNQIYHTSMGDDIRGGITRSGTSGSYTYSVKPNMGNKPVNWVSWFRCARYCNWLHNGKPTGEQNRFTTEDGAYPLFGTLTGIVRKNEEYANIEHQHISSDIANFSSSVNTVVSGVYAPLNSPAFTGIPTVPTAPSGTNNTQIANTSFVRTEISNLVDSAPITLDTLNELAAALGDDPNFATTVTNLIGNKISKSGDTMTGTLYAPTGVFSSGLTLNGTTVSVSGHTHSYSDITNFASGVSDSLTTTLLAGSFIALDYNSSLDTLTISATGLQPSGNYSVVGHTHTSSNITDFNSSVSGLLPVKNVIGSGYVNVSSSSGNYTISVSGLQPSGNYANSIHTHTASDITDFNSSVSGLIPVKDILAGSGIVVSSTSGIYTIDANISGVILETIQDNLGSGFLVAGTGVKLTYNDAANTLRLDNLHTEINELSLEPQGFVNRLDSIISFNDSTRTFTIAPSGSSYDVYIEGVKVTKTSSESIVIGSGTALNYIHFNTDTGLLDTKTTGFNFDTDVPIAFIHWNGDINQSTFFGEERHGIRMDSMTHKWIHNTFGMQYISGLSIGGYTLLGNGSSNSHAQIDISDGVLYQEDIIINVTNGTGIGSFIQQLTPIAYIPVYYHLGSTGQWVRDTATPYPLKYNATRALYNLYSGGTWTTPNVTNNRYFAMWIVATNDINDPILAIMGQREDSSLTSAENYNIWSDINLTNIPTNELRPLYRLIFVTDDTFTNTPKSSLQSILDLRKSIITSTYGVSQNDHGNLFGLGDDDHAQYVHINEARSISANHTFTNGLTISSGLLSANSGNFTSLSVNNVQVSVSGHTHTSSNITDFNTSVSGLLPVTNIVSGSGINVSASGSQFTISMIDDPRWAFFLPQAPTDVVGSAANESVILGWNPAVSPIPVTDYIVQYSDDSGSTWNTFVDGTSSSTTATITGLTNGTSYIFRVKAVNAIGQGTFSNPSSSIAPDIQVAASLLLRFDNDFTDSSPSNLTVTSAGDSSISTAQSKFGGASLYTDASSDNRSGATVTPPFSMGSQWTVEAWVWVNGDSSGYRTLFARRYVNDGASFSVDLSGNLNAYSSAGSVYSSSLAVPADQWVHVAWTMDGDGILRMFVNGIMEEYGAAAFAFNDAATVGYIFFPDSYEESWKGYIDDLRVVSNLAVYTGPFNPPTAPLSAYAMQMPVSRDASLLLRFDGDFNDASPNDLTVTANGDAATSASQSKFGGESFALDGADDSLTVSGAGALMFNGSPTFTIEAWVRPDATQVGGPSGGGNSGAIISTRTAPVYANYELSIRDNLKLTVLVRDSASNWGIATVSSATLSADTWHHLAIVCDAGYLTLYVDGVADSTINELAINFYDAGDSEVYIGQGGDGYFHGYIDDLRVVKGLAVYTGPFNPPTAPLAVNATPVPVGRDATLLLRFDGNFNDASPNNLTVTANGDAAIDATTVKYGGGAAYFDGDGDSLTVPHSAGFDFATGDFTVELWAWFNNASSYRAFVQLSGGWVFYFYPNTIYWGVPLVSNDVEGSFTPTTNTWHHIAASRSGGTLRIFVDGSEVASGSAAGSYSSGTSGDLIIGTYVSEYFNGYIDDLRIVKGLAVYTGNFTPPTAPLPVTATPVT